MRVDIAAARERATELLKRVEHRPWQPDQPFEQAVEELRRSLALLESDIAERRRMEDLYRTVVDTAGAAILVCDTELHLMEFNREAERIFGYERREVIGDSILERLIPDDQREPAKRVAQRVEAGETVRGMELPIVPKSGRRRVLLWNATRLCNNAGAPTGLIAIGHDITDRKQVEERFRNSQKMEAIGRLAGGIAHDFNNLLLAIQGRVSFLLRDRATLGSLVGHVEGIRDAASQATKLTRQLLTFSRQRVARRAVLNLNRVIEGMAELIRRLTGEDVDLKLRLPPKLRPVSADRSQLEQVVMNFVFNARDAMPAGGTIQIETRNADDGEWVELVVTDTGCGMDAETLARIFEPFFTTKPEGRGTGLGLSTVYGIVQRFGGQLDVQSAPGAGSRFIVRLRAVDGVPEPMLPIADEPPPPRPAAKTVLLVEDNFAVRIVLEEYLRQGGYRVLVASNAEEATAEAEQHSDEIDVLVSDVVMPGLSGPALAERLVAAKPELRVLYLSGYARNETPELRSDRSAFLQKPFDAPVLLRALRDLLR